MRKEAVT